MIVEEGRKKGQNISGRIAINILISIESSMDRYEIPTQEKEDREKQIGLGKIAL